MGVPLTPEDYGTSDRSGPAKKRRKARFQSPDPVVAAAAAARPKEYRGKAGTFDKLPPPRRLKMSNYASTASNQFAKLWADLGKVWARLGGFLGIFWGKFWKFFCHLEQYVKI